MAAALGADLPTLLRGLGAQPSDAQLVRKGEGLEVVRRGTKRGHTYHLLASDRGPRKTFEPFLVTLNDKSEIFPDFEHPGTEMIHMLEGSLRYRHGTESYLLKPGDTLTFSGEVPHGPQKLIRLPIRFLSIIVYGEEKGWANEVDGWRLAVRTKWMDANVAASVTDRRLPTVNRQPASRAQPFLHRAGQRLHEEGILRHQPHRDVVPRE